MNNHNSSNESHDRDSSNGSNCKSWLAAIVRMGATAKAAMAGVNNRNGSNGREYHNSIKVSGGKDVRNRRNDCNGSNGNKVRDCSGRSHNHKGSIGTVTTGATVVTAAATTTGVTAAKAATGTKAGMNTAMAAMVEGPFGKIRC